MHRSSAREFTGARRLRAQQDRNAAGVAGAQHVDIGIANEPDFRPHLQTAAGERQRDGLDRRLVARRIVGADQTFEMPGPAQGLSLSAQQVAALVADHRQVVAGRRQESQRPVRVGPRPQALQMARLEAAIEDPGGLLGAVAEQLGEAVARRAPDPQARLRHGPGPHPHGPQGRRERMMDHHPAVDQRVVPVEQQSARARVNHPSSFKLSTKPR